ncbi:dihydrofolate reductase family protein [Cryobacterium sp. Y57]|uniref:dihydrofolate reductase family protein n=1 Tax=Cryobacterium sp. Y57 TaxID=2048287 RepID=UPI000CE53235|nr:dihydrofolate reductase family protein [Cryobacterium sp. Y57]
MRKLTAGLFMSLDGVVESPNLWQFDSFDEELGVEMTAMMSRVDTVLLGRVGYEEWAGYWPGTENDDPFGAFINAVQKFVASRTLTGDLAWQNSTLVTGDLTEFVTDLKRTEGGEISLIGGISLVRQLLFAGLLDSLSLMTHPVVAGGGRHLFEPTDPVTRLTLQSSVMTSNGNALLTYGPRRD